MQCVTGVFSFLQHVDEANSYLCGYLKIKGLTEEYPTLTTFFDGEIISEKYPFLTRKWDADEEVDKKHWVRFVMFKNVIYLDNEIYLAAIVSLGVFRSFFLTAIFFLLMLTS